MLAKKWNSRQVVLGITHEAVTQELAGRVDLDAWWTKEDFATWRNHVLD